METIVKKYVSKPKTKPSQKELEKIEESINITLEQINAVENDKDGIMFTNETRALEIKKKQLQLLQKRKEAMQNSDKVQGKKYRKINLDFFKKTKLQRIEAKRNGNRVKATIKVPMFSYHKLDTYSDRYCFQNSQFRVDIKGGQITYFDISNLNSDHIIYKKINAIYKKSNLPKQILYCGRYLVADMLEREIRINATDKFSGLIPTEVKKEIIEAKDIFDEIFLVKEAKWQLEIIEKDPLIIGLLNGEAYLISHFDCTPFEHYVKSEF